ncbi:MAG: DUF4191 domain-containing protein [Actinomycetes bacterium]
MSRKDGKPGRFSQLFQVYKVTRKADPRIGLWLIGSLLVPFLVGLAIGFVLKSPVMLGLLGFTAGVLLATIVFGRRAERAQYTLIAGQPGASAAALGMLRRGWTTTPAVAMDRYQSYVSRVTGRPGVVLVGDGQPNRVRHLMALEKKRVARVAPETPVHEFIVGDDDGLTPLPKLVRRIQKLPRVLSQTQVNEVNRRLKSLESANGPLPIPKGPLPKGARMPKMPR